MQNNILNSIINGDTLEELKKLPSNFVDMGITSPPYNKGEKQKRRKKKRNTRKEKRKRTREGKKEKGTRKEHIKGERRGERRERLLTGEDRNKGNER